MLFCFFLALLLIIENPMASIFQEELHYQYAKNFALSHSAPDTIQYHDPRPIRLYLPPDFWLQFQSKIDSFVPKNDFMITNLYLSGWISDSCFLLLINFFWIGWCIGLDCVLLACKDCWCLNNYYKHFLLSRNVELCINPHPTPFFPTSFTAFVLKETVLPLIL